MARIELVKTKSRYHTVQTLEDLAKGFEIPISAANAEYAGSCEPEEGNPAWRGGISTREQVTALLNDGWQQGANDLSTLSRDPGFASLPGVRTRKRVSRWSDAGEDLNIDRALRGDWDIAWRTSRREVTAGPTCIDLISAWGGACGRSAEELFWSGAAMLVACDLLEQAGYRVRLLATMAIDSRGGSRPTHRADVILKDDHEPLRVDALAGVVCHAGVFRTVGFREICRAPWSVGYSLGSYLGVGSLPADLAPDAESSIIMPDAYDRASAARNIAAVIRKVQGGAQ